MASRTVLIRLLSSPRHTARRVPGDPTEEPPAGRGQKVTDPCAFRHERSPTLVSSPGNVRPDAVAGVDLRSNTSTDLPSDPSAVGLEGGSGAGVRAMSSLAAITARVAAIAARQHGVIAHRQLVVAGLTTATISRWAAAGHLHRLHRGVYAVGHPNVSWEGRLLAAVFACRDGAMLSHSSATRLWAVERETRGPIHVSTPRDSRRAPRGVLVHRPRRLDAADCTSRHGIPVTTATRALFDQASSSTATALRRQFEQAEYLEVLDRRRLAALLEDASGRRGLGTLRALLAERSLPLAETRSVFERLLLRICRDHGVPLPAVNVPLLGYEVDFLWPAARLVVEADGGHHRGRRRDHDNERDARLSRAGYLVRRYSSVALADEARIAAEILDILGERLGARQTAG